MPVTILLKSDGERYGIYSETTSINQTIALDEGLSLSLCFDSLIRRKGPEDIIDRRRSIC
jgi:hypothetical protein